MKKRRKKSIVNDTILSLIIVTKNDEDIIEEVLQGIKQKLAGLNIGNEIIIVDNNSGDETIAKIRKLQRSIPYIRILKLSKEYEQEIALTAGLDNCIGDYAILFNLYTDPSEVIPSLFEKLSAQFDIVAGEDKSAVFKYGLFSRMFLGVIYKISTHQFAYAQSYLLGLNRRAINSIIQTRRKSRSISYINYLIGFRKAVISYKSSKKYLYKVKKEDFFQVVSNVSNIIISNSFKPIRILSFFGMFASISFLLYVFSIALIKLFLNISLAPEGWITLGAVLGVMFFILFSFLTIIAEYIIRILNEARNEPFYFIADEIDKSIIFPKKDLLNVL